MSFSQEVRQELSAHVASARHCNLAELAAIIGMTGEIWVSGAENAGPDAQHSRYHLRIRTENLSVARKSFTLLKKTFNISSIVSVHLHKGAKKSGPVYTVQVQTPESVRQIMRALKLPEGEFRREAASRTSADASGVSENPEERGRRLLALPETASPLLLQQSCCRRAYLRGAFLCAGSISNPEKSYHFEIACSSAGCARQLQTLIRTFGPDAKIVQRKKQFIVYIKEGDQIVNMLNIMEAHISLMNLENIRIVREMRNTVNRKVNCEAANINKTVGAAVRQIEDIRYLKAVKGLGSLPAGLADIAKLRLANPDASLKELGEMADPPVGKSGVNHRLRKLSRLAEMVRQNKEELL